MLMTLMPKQCRADGVTDAAAREAMSKSELGQLCVVPVRVKLRESFTGRRGMAEVNGYELIARVRALGPEKGGDLPVIAITAYAGKEDRLRAITSGFQYY